MGNNMFAYCLNNPANCTDSCGNRAVAATANAYGDSEENDEEDGYNLVGAGFQLSGSVIYGHVGGGGGIEIVIFWGTPECKTSGNVVVAVYGYIEGDISINTGTLPEEVSDIVELILNNSENLKLDGANALQALIAGKYPEISVSGSFFAITASNNFTNAQDYCGGFQNKAVDFGSIKVGKAWSDCCRTYSLGYTYTFTKPWWQIKLPTVSRGSSYYEMLWTSN